MYVICLTTKSIDFGHKLWLVMGSVSHCQVIFNVLLSLP